MVTKKRIKRYIYIYNIYNIIIYLYGYLKSSIIMKKSPTSVVIIKTTILIVSIIMFVCGLAIILSEPLPNQEINLISFILLKLFGFSFVFISITFINYVFKKE